jgi:DNA invertase Pin-like site-specific DNA recombinase
MNTKQLPRAGDSAVPRALLYLRVSTPRQMDTAADVDPEGNSIDTQRREAQAKARSLGAVVAEDGEYVEPGNSAQSIEKRPVFRAMLKRLAEKRDAEYVIVYNYSRAFRNRLDEAITKSTLQKLGVRLVSAKENFGEGPMADAMEGVVAVFNELQVRMNGEDIKVKMANKARGGGTLGRAKLGYLNTRLDHDGHKVNTIAVDPERANYVRMAFELFAGGSHTLASLQRTLTEAGLRTRGGGRWPSQPISAEKLRTLLRDRYYCGYLTYKGMEYKGRHEPLITEELYDRVQRVLDAHQGAGVRERSHPHYLKGTVWCQRCEKRFIVQRAVGQRGGEYYYFFCRGRQDGLCDHPYVPVEVMEKAVADHYGTSLWLPEEFRDEVRALVDEAVAENVSLSDELRQQYQRRLSTLDNKESYMLDLAAEEGWPKDMLREKIAAIRIERKDIQASLDSAERQLEVGRQVFERALELLHDPKALYLAADETTRAVLNKAFFTKIMVDGRKVSGQELREPFDVLDGAYRSYQRREAMTYYRTTSGSLAAVEADVEGGVAAEHGDTRQDPTLLTEGGVFTDVSLTGLLDLALAFRAGGSSRKVMVGDTGIEPVTSSV